MEQYLEAYLCIFVYFTYFATFAVGLIAKMSFLVMCFVINITYSYFQARDVVSEGKKENLARTNEIIGSYFILGSKPLYF